MTKKEFLYEHDLDLVNELITRHMKWHYPSEEDIAENKHSESFERMNAGEFLI